MISKNYPKDLIIISYYDGGISFEILYKGVIYDVRDIDDIYESDKEYKPHHISKNIKEELTYLATCYHKIDECYCEDWKKEMIMSGVCDRYNCKILVCNNGSIELYEKDKK